VKKLAVVLCVLTFGCGYHLIKEVTVNKTVETTISKPTPDIRKVIRIFGQDSIGHGCPISTTEAYTAAHVTGSFVGGEGDVRRAPPTAWGDGFGGGGVLQEQSVSLARDLSRTKNLRGEFLYWFGISPRNPIKGETVYLVGYNHGGKFEQVLHELVVLEVFAGHILYDGSGLGGSSGSCVLLGDGTMVAVNIGHVEADGYIGIGALVTGDWNDTEG